MAIQPHHIKMGWFILVLIGVPLLDTWLLINVSSHIGSLTDTSGMLYTIGLVILTAVLGGRLVKQQGFAVWMKIQQQIQSGQTPAIELFEGGCILVAGALLITPGFITDAIGFALLIPPLRLWVAKQWLRYRVNRPNRPQSTQHSHFRYFSYRTNANPPPPRSQQRQPNRQSPNHLSGDIIDTDGYRVDDD